MRMLLAPVVALLLAGCSGDPIRRVAAPAPAGALECASRALAALGYALDWGDPDRGFLHLQRPPESLVADLVTVEEGGGELRLLVSTRTHRNRHGPPTEQAMLEARSVLSRCGLGATDAGAGAAPREAA